MKETLFFILIIVCLSCNTQETQTIDTIIIASGGCHGDCPHFALKIDKSLNCYYYGGQNAKNKGFYSGKISKEIFKNFSREIKKSKYFELDTLYANKEDFTELEILIEEKGKKKRVEGDLINLPVEFRRVVLNIINTVEAHPLKQVPDSLSFETRRQYLPQEKDRIRFLPDSTKQFK